MHHDIVLRRARVAHACQCPCNDPGRETHEDCVGEIAAGELVIEHIDAHGHTSIRCEVCGPKPDEE